MNTNTNRIKQWQEQEALSRFQLIAPLLQEDLDDAKRLQLRKQIAQDNDISVRSIYRYEKAYREGQFAGLKPAAREKRRSQKLPENFDLLLEQAVQLRKEVPERSVAQIICILELEGYAAPGVLKRNAPLWNGTCTGLVTEGNRCRCTAMHGEVLPNVSANRTV